MNHLLMSIPDTLVALVAVSLSFLIPIVAIYFSYQNKNKIMDARKLMIEKGITPPPLPNSLDRFQSNSSLHRGLKLIAIALGLLAGYFLSTYTDIRFPFSIIGSILFFLGIVHVISSFLPDNKQSNSSSNTSNHEQQ